MSFSLVERRRRAFSGKALRNIGSLGGGKPYGDAGCQAGGDGLHVAEAPALLLDFGFSGGGAGAACPNARCSWPSPPQWP